MTQPCQQVIGPLCRYGNPTTRVVEEKIRELEGAEDCLVSSSGMNSATTMMLALVPAGGHIVTTTDCYRRTRSVTDPLSATRLCCWNKDQSQLGQALLLAQEPVSTRGRAGLRSAHWQAA